MPYTYLLTLVIGLFAFVALLSLADAVFTQPAPPTVVVQFWQEQNNDALVAIVLVLGLGVIVVLMLMHR